MGSTTGHPMQRPSRRWHARRGAAAILGLVSFFVAGVRGEEPSRGGPADLARYDARVKAEDREHWAFLPVVEPEVPAVKDSAWVRNPIDAFVLAELEAQGWTPAPPAEASAPAPAGLPRPDRPAADARGAPGVPRRPLARCLDRRVDELLARPSYGERWGRHWLDLVRYRRDQRLRARRHQAERLALPRLRHPRVQRRQALRPLPPGAARRRRAPRRERRDARRHRLLPARPLGRRAGRPEAGPVRPARRHGRHHLGGLPGADARLRPLPRPQVRPALRADYYRMVAVFNPLERPVDGRTERDLPAGSPSQVAAEAERDRQIEAIDAGSPGGATPGVRATSSPAGARSPPRRSRRSASSRASGPRPRRRSSNDHKKALDEELAATLPEEDKAAIAADEGEIRRLRAATPDLPRGYFLREPTPNPPGDPPPPPRPGDGPRPRGRAGLPRGPGRLAAPVPGPGARPRPPAGGAWRWRAGSPAPSTR